MSRTATPSLRAQVLDAAAKRCDAFRDKPPARKEMKQAVLDTPAELLPDLLTALTTYQFPIEARP